MIWLLSNYRLVIAGIGIFGIIGLYFYVGHLRAENQRLAHTLEISEANYKICQTQKQTTEKAANDWEDKAASINSKYSSINKRLRDGSACVQVLPAPGKPHESANGAGVPGSVGVSAQVIIDEARACDEATERLIGLQNYLKTFNKGE